MRRRDEKRYEKWRKQKMRGNKERRELRSRENLRNELVVLDFAKPSDLSSAQKRAELVIELRLSKYLTLASSI